jgi:hypothetical protein
MRGRKLTFERLEARRVLAADFNADATVDDLDLRNWRAGFGTVGTAAPEQGDSDGDMDVDGMDFLDWQRGFGPTQNNLIAYRPQGPQPENPPDAPRYTPFPKRPVSEVFEFDAMLGPGIRTNDDDDDLNGFPDASDIGYEIPRENDLIEVKVQAVDDIEVVLIPDTSQLRLYYDHDKETLIPIDGTGATEVLDLVGGELTVWVEWKVLTHGTAALTLQNADTFQNLDAVRFHSFQSLIIAFGGDGQDPNDTDFDGSIGDPTGPGGNREGIFDIAQDMYNTGWDVLAFDEENLNAPEQVPWTEAVIAHEERLVELGIIGYSHGGGAVHNLIEKLWFDDFYGNGDPDRIVTRIGVYLDAVVHGAGGPEDRWPFIVFHLMNFYQTVSTLHGAHVDDTEAKQLGATVDNYPVSDEGSPFPPGLHHLSIDDDPFVQQLIRNGLEDLLINR